MSCFPGLRVVRENAKTKREPEDSSGIFEDRVDGPCCIPRRISHFQIDQVKIIFVSVEEIETLHRPDPKVPLPVLTETSRGAAGKRVRINLTMLEDGDIVSVILIEAVGCSEPHKALMVLEDAVDR